MKEHKPKNDSKAGWAKRMFGVMSFPLAAATTPLLLFIRTTDMLYLKGAEAVGRDVHVLHQFWIAAAWALAIGFILSILARFLRFKTLAFLFWAYVLLGPFFFAYAFLHVQYRQTMDDVSVFGTFWAVYLLATLALTLKGNVVVGRKVFAVLCICLVPIEAALVVIQADAARPPDVQETKGPEPDIDKDRAGLPNVYHIVFDTFQTEFFEFARNPEVDKGLAGFTYYPENVGTYSSSMLAVPSVFVGNFRAESVSDDEYWFQALNTEKSFLHWLIESGYETHALKYGHDDCEYFQHRLGERQPSSDGKESAGDLATTFRALWVATYLPAPLAAQWSNLGVRGARQKREFVVPASLERGGHTAFGHFLEEEAGMRDHARYTFLQLKMPDPAFAIAGAGFPETPDNGNTRPTTSLEDQILESTQLIVQFAERLRELGRFEDSLIIIHGGQGYGSYSETETGKLAENQNVSETMEVEAHSHSLLLIKFPGPCTASSLSVCDARTSLLDIAPTILAVLRVDSEQAYAGIDLTKPEGIPTDRARYFYTSAVRKKQNRPGIERTMTRWIVRDGEYENAGLTVLPGPVSSLVPPG